MKCCLNNFRDTYKYTEYVGVYAGGLSCEIVDAEEPRGYSVLLAVLDVIHWLGPFNSDAVCYSSILAMLFLVWKEYAVTRVLDPKSIEPERCVL